MKYIYIISLSIIIFSLTSCTVDLLEQEPTTELGAAAFWQTEEDATFALMGAYSKVRPIFDRDYHFDGHGEFIKVYNTGVAPISMGVNNPSNYGAGADPLYEACYGAINHTNYVIENIEKVMIPRAQSESEVESLERIIGEAKLLRGMVYFRLISLWGDVPYISRIINDNSEVESLTRLPLAQLKDSILTDFTYAYETLPEHASETGRAAQPAALSFRGKLQLYWASWNNYGWPELETFTPSAQEATIAYTAAAEDFKKVIENYGLQLFRGGEPGEWGSMGNAEILPNYYYMFIPSTGNPNEDGEMIMVFTHGGTGTGQSEELMRVFTGRSVEGSQNQVIPRFELANRYQSTITGDFVEPLIPMNPSTPGARTAPNSAINPESYANRDYRMKGSLLWDYELIQGLASLKETAFVPFIYKTWSQEVTINGETLTSFNDGGTNRSGLDFRKFIRNYGGQNRSSGDYNWPVMRLADVFLMYAEATNEINGPQPDAIELVNRIRHRGNLPPLAADKVADKESFFEAIEQERIVELLAEGHRGFDLRRWRAIERVFGEPYGDGRWFRDTHGANWERFFFNAPEITYERCYIYRIPESERERNPELTQNAPWR
ncbi:MAG TPA: RagB/SusD family nutrient uptake outer membrane protein [Membranihabitans sp.]|nr:RagB/SusD family nutrient uptake outer membrane protein [Membranihabitans sp.]